MTSLQSKALIYFERLHADYDANHKYKCLIDGCEKVYDGRKKSNLVVHIKLKHLGVYENFIDPPAELRNSVPMAIRRIKFIRNCTELVTINSCPFSHLNLSGYQKSTEYELNVLKQAGYGTGLGSPHRLAVKEYIKDVSLKVIDRIKAETKNKFVSLMVDTATKNKRSIMGLCLQFIVNGRTVIRSIGMIQLTESHSSVNLMRLIFDRLSLYGINKEQLISVTTDNAANMTCMIRHMNENFEDDSGNPADAAEKPNTHIASERDTFDATEENQATELMSFLNFEFDEDEEELIASTDLLADEDARVEAELAEMLSDRVDLENLLRDLRSNIDAHTMNIKGVRCASHTLQLAIRDALSSEKRFSFLIKLCRAVCKLLRKQSYANKLHDEGIMARVPRLDVVTRWNSTYIMVLTIVFVFSPFNKFTCRVFNYLFTAIRLVEVQRCY